MKILKEGLCAPKGFSEAAVACGIKVSGKLDLGLVFSLVAGTAVGVFTQNKFRAAPVLVSHKQLKSGRTQAIIANAGNANCATGEKGLRDAWNMVKEVSVALGIKKSAVLVTSTGVIGKPMPMEKISKGIKKLKKYIKQEKGGKVAHAIMTTDTYPKEIAVEIMVSGKPVRISGCAKGSGMIHPNMATMHAFILTDAKIDRRTFGRILKASTDETFNMITVDKETSTNDCVLALANGLAGVDVSHSAEFSQAFKYVCEYLAKEIARDGEGAHHLVEIEIMRSASIIDARLLARQLASSFLLKAAIFGKDPNWGRVIACIGYTNIRLNPKVVKIYLGDILLFNKGMGQDFDKNKARSLLGKKEVKFTIDLGIGKFGARAWGCDLSYDYVKINADYHT